MSDASMQPMRQIAAELATIAEAVEGGSMAALADAVSGADRVFIAGAGRSGLMMRATAMRIMHLGLEVYVVGDVVTPGIAPGDLLLIGSGSGATASLVAAAEKARQLGAEVALITIDPTSVIGQIASTVVTVPAPSPKARQQGAITSVQPMGSLFEQSLLLVGDGLILLLMQRLNTNSATMFQRHANLE